MSRIVAPPDEPITERKVIVNGEECDVTCGPTLCGECERMGEPEPPDLPRAWCSLFGGYMLKAAPFEFFRLAECKHNEVTRDKWLASLAERCEVPNGPCEGCMQGGACDGADKP
jgi:hypothetical protein